MSQNSMVLPTTGTVSGLQMAQHMNNALDTLNTLASGASAPSAPEAGQWWHDISANILKIRNQANTAWINICALDETLGLVMPPVGGGSIVSLASAATTDLWSVPQSYVKVTGTATITALCGATSSKPGTIKFVIFSGALTLTYNATSLITPTGANITTASGDTAIVISLGSGNVVVFSYNPAGSTLLKAVNNLSDVTNAATALSNLGGAPIVAGARAWGNISGSGAVSKGYNIASVSANGSGSYTVNFTSPMADTHYSVVATLEHSGTISGSNGTYVNVRPDLRKDVNGFMIAFVLTGAGQNPSGFNIAVYD